MAIQVIPRSQRLSGVTSFDWEYTVTGTLTIDTAADAVFLASPIRYGFWVRNWTQKTIEELGGGAWNFTVPYNVGAFPSIAIPSVPGSSGGSGYTLPDESAPIPREWQIDYGAGTRRILSSREIIQEKSYVLTAGDPLIVSTDLTGRTGGGPIGLNPRTGDVTGIDVPDPVQRRELTLKIAGVTSAYMKKLEARQFDVNQEAFMGRLPGEVRFDGARLATKDADAPSIVLTFAVAKNRVNVTVGRFLTVNCDGWDYIDPTYGVVPDPDDSTKGVWEVVKATVHRIHPRSDLNDLFT